MPSAELIHQWPLLWDAKTQWLLFRVCISVGVRRKAPVQLRGGFTYSRWYQRGKGFSLPWSVIPTLHPRCTYQGKHSAGDGVGAWTGGGAGHGVGAHVALAGDSGRAPTAAWLTRLCTSRHGCSLMLPALSPPGFSRELPRGSGCRNEPKFHRQCHMHLSVLCVCGPSFPVPARG